MRRITRYILAEFLKLSLVMSVCMTAGMILVVVGQEAIRQGLGPTAVIKLLPYALPVALAYVVPGTVLFAACSIYGRMSAMNEITAVKSLGISPMTLLWPALLFSFFISLSAVWLNDVAAWGRIGLKRVALESAEQIAYGMLRSSRSYSRGGLSINVKDVQGHVLVRPTLTVYESEDRPPIRLTAEFAEIDTDAERDVLLVSMTNGEIERGDDIRMDFPGTEVIEVPLSAAAGGGKSAIRPADTALRRIPGEIVSQRAELEDLERTLAADAAYQLMTGDFTDLSDERWADQQAVIAGGQARLARLCTEPWRRWANGFSCFAFVLVGAPLAVRMRNADVWTSFIACFLPILIVYYPLLAYGVDLSKAGDLPPYSVWLANVVLMAAGYWMTRGMIRN
ncbi:MAG: LptF/LptG family permease [Planctomycetaceae bacterium]|nr:LptF/LptG family permease [Planctomycetales bacterium]MCB9938908.1 LptF/LptG family permease [Planctomycetaceae bacterium]